MPFVAERAAFERHITFPAPSNEMRTGSSHRPPNQQRKRPSLDNVTLQLAVYRVGRVEPPGRVDARAPVTPGQSELHAFETRVQEQQKIVIGDRLAVPAALIEPRGKK
jgi:hypothetical protein